MRELDAPQPSAPAKGKISDEAWLYATSAWTNEHVRNSPIAQSIEAWNHLGLILPHLRTLLETELSK